METFICSCGQRSQIKVKGHQRSTCKITWKCKFGLICILEDQLELPYTNRCGDLDQMLTYIIRKRRRQATLAVRGSQSFFFFFFFFPQLLHILDKFHSILGIFNCALNNADCHANCEIYLCFIRGPQSTFFFSHCTTVALHFGQIPFNFGYLRLCTKQCRLPRKLWTLFVCVFFFLAHHLTLHASFVSVW